MDKSEEPPPYVVQEHQHGMPTPQVVPPRNIMRCPQMPPPPPPYTMPQPNNMMPQPQVRQQINVVPQMAVPTYVTQSPQMWVNLVRLGPAPQVCTCPNCHATIITDVRSEPTMKTHIMALILCGLCCLPCLPYFMDSCKNKNHYCPSCCAFLGTYTN